MENILKELECMVCNKYMYKEIPTCSEGHSICKPCNEVVLYCPLCQEKFLSGRRKSLEKISENILKPCKNGCGKILLKDGDGDHENVCSKNPKYIFQCPLRYTDIRCYWTGCHTDLMGHVKNHENKILQQRHKYGNGSVQLEMKIYFAFDEVFTIYKEKVNEDYNDWRVVYIGPEEKAKDFIMVHEYEKNRDYVNLNMKPCEAVKDHGRTIDFNDGFRGLSHPNAAIIHNKYDNFCDIRVIKKGTNPYTAQSTNNCTSALLVQSQSSSRSTSVLEAEEVRSSPSKQASIKYTSASESESDSDSYSDSSSLSVKASSSTVKTKYFPCSVCGRVITSQTRLCNHMLTHIKSEADKEPRFSSVKPSSSTVKPKYFPCSVCGRVITSQIRLLNHMRIHFKRPASKEPRSSSVKTTSKTVKTTSSTIKTTSSNLKPSSSTGNTKYFPCILCGKVITSQIRYRNHLSMHYKKQQK